ncbi:MAG: AraC family transcriptional regulator [Lentisphaeria bacterium]
MENAFFNPGIQLLICDRTRLDARWNVANYAAPYWRLYWNSQPGARVTLGGVTTALEADRFVLIPPETPFAGRVAGTPEHVYIHFRAAPPYEATRPSVHTIPADGWGLRQVQRLAAIRQSPEAWRERSLLALALVHAALAQIPEADLQPSLEDPRILRVVEFLQSRPGRMRSNPELARVAGLSTNAFIRLFRARTGLTPQAFHLRKRLEQACVDLHYSGLKIEEIARRAGFHDRYHFTHVFKRLRGLGPAAFRRQAGCKASGT